MIKLTEKDQSMLVGIFDGTPAELRQLQLESVEALLETIQKYNQKIFEHSFRVASLCADISAHLGLASDRMKQTILGALLHDIGIIGINRALFDQEIK